MPRRGLVRWEVFDDLATLRGALGRTSRRLLEAIAKKDGREMEDTLVELQTGARKGAERILRDCLGLKTSEHLTIFHDPTTREVAEVILEVAQGMGIAPNDCFVTLEEQRAFQIPPGLSQKHLYALEDARGILTCLSDDSASTNFRKELITRGTNSDTRLGHMPGASLQVLAFAAIDHREAQQHCEELALALAIGHNALLQTYELDEIGGITKEHSLRLDLRGLDRAPITSTGIIPLDTWGNIPGAETFIAPWEDSAEGSFVLNGSFSGAVMPPGKSIVLRFQRGRLVSIDSNDLGIAARFSTLFDGAKLEGDDSYSVLAELGIGVNSAIKSLTGLSLVDEKCAGTAHIALGDSRRYGGRNGSKIHEDLVTLGPSLTIDGEPILDHGDYVLSTQTWFPCLSSMELKEPFNSDDFNISRTDLSVQSGPPLKIRREVAVGRIGMYSLVKSDVENRLISSVYRATRFLPEATDFNSLLERVNHELGADADVRMLRASLQLLTEHKALVVDDN